MLSPRAPAVPMGLQVSALPLPQAPRVGLEPTTTRLTAECSTIELSRIILSLYPQNQTLNLFHLLSDSTSVTLRGLLPASPVLTG